MARLGGRFPFRINLHGILEGDLIRLRLGFRPSAVTGYRLCPRMSCWKDLRDKWLAEGVDLSPAGLMLEGMDLHV